MAVIFKRPEDRLDMIMGFLLRYLPFYGRAAMYLKWGVREDLPFPTAATDGKNVWFHPEFLAKMNDGQLLYTAIHEIHHVIKKHILLKGDRDHMLWNIACDHKINLELNRYVKEVGKTNYLEQPPSIVFDEKYNNNKWLEEDVYNDLLENPPEFMQSVTGVFMDDPSMGPGEAAKAEEHRRIDKIIEASAKAARDAGKMPGFLEDLVLQNKKKQVDWKIKLRRFMAPIYPTLHSWERLNKRAISRGYYIPGVQKTGVANLAILVDTSGSVSNEEIQAFIGEMAYIINEMHPQNVQLIYFESHPYLIENYSAGQTLKIPQKLKRGGTNFKAGFEAITNKPKAIICLTDMYDSFNFTSPAPTMWVATSDVVAPWGETIRIKV